MKLRIQELSVILRLQPDEVLLLSEKRKLVQIAKLPGDEINIILEVRDVEYIGMHYSQNSFIFSFPKEQLEAWCTSNKVGYSRALNDLTLTIEKDMPRKSKNAN